MNIQISFTDTYTGEHSSFEAEVDELTAEALVQAIVEPGEEEDFKVLSFGVRDGVVNFQFGVRNVMGEEYVITGSAQ